MAELRAGHTALGGKRASSKLGIWPESTSSVGGWSNGGKVMNNSFILAACSFEKKIEDISKS